MQSDLSPAAGETIGQRLKRLRLGRNLSQRELAAPGVSYAYISRIEAGTRQPSVKALRRLAAKLEVSAEYLETGSELPPADLLELRLADLELALRLGEADEVQEPLEAVLDEAVSAGDRALALPENRPGVALAHARKASALLEATDDTVGLARAHILAASIMITRADPDEATMHLDSAERLVGATGALVDSVRLRVKRAQVAN